MFDKLTGVNKTIRCDCFGCLVLDLSAGISGINKMGVTVEQGGFSTREEAKDLIEGLGLFARDGAMGTGDLEDVHWHKTSLRIYVLTGSFETRDATADVTLMAGAGEIVSIPEQTLHAARCPDPATYVVGFESEAAAKSFRPETPESYPGS